MRLSSCGSVRQHPYRRATDETGTVVWNWNSESFGASLANNDPDGDGVTTTINLRFAGQYFDSETNLHYNYFRYYNPSTGRYITSDPIGLSGGLNTFGYVRGNPLRFTDPQGKNAGALGVAAFCVGLAIGSVLDAATAPSGDNHLQFWIDHYTNMIDDLEINCPIGNRTQDQDDLLHKMKKERLALMLDLAKGPQLTSVKAMLTSIGCAAAMKLALRK